MGNNIFLEQTNSIKHKKSEIQQFNIDNIQYKEWVNKNFIVPIRDKNNLQCGCGFFIEDLFFTSGHVWKSINRAYININSQEFELTEDIRILCYNDDNCEGYDIAIFRFPNIKSDIEFCLESMSEGMEVESISFYDTLVESNQFYSYPIYCTAKILGIHEGNYFGIETSKSLKKGSSGSPIFSNGKVVGIITKGNNNGDDTLISEKVPLNFCYILSVKAITSLI
ncbi:MAG: trypsin-like peptidase domain-containing protein [Bacteroidales bacterium]|nr:trypsin-like peptidase domain-containing protein [Bacteroidales bacterium]